ncbi:MAG: 2-C-methyl-D-erythritol 4-phosphate cytidylyltransferase, partial [Spirochaetales bacterium]|nr:2-C-methyl-D-erythritol 4-phosphate cytidylyltransferase [Spirochaetales bacterium]
MFNEMRYVWFCIFMFYDILCFMNVIVLAAGSGKRLGGELPKQYLLLNVKPVLYYSLKVFEKSPLVESISVVISQEDLLYSIGLIVLISGIVTGLWGVILAAMQNDIKRLLAYSSIENVGVILIGLGIAAVGHAAGSNLIGMCGMCGALLHIVNHSLFKSMLFFSAGNIYSKMHTTAMNQMGGLAKHMPVTAILMLFATVAICALPPLNGFVSELLIYIGMFNGVSDGHEVLYSVSGIIALSLIGGIVVLAFTKLYGTVFLGTPRSTHVAESSEVDNLRIGAMAIPAAMILIIGLFPQFAIRPIAIVA